MGFALKRTLNLRKIALSQVISSGIWGIVISIALKVDSSFNTDLDFSKLTIVGSKATYSRESDNTQTLKLTFEDKSSGLPRLAEWRSCPVNV